MKKATIIASVFLAYIVLFTLLLMIYFYSSPGKNQYIGTTITSESGADLRKIEIKTCSGEGELFLYEGDDPFQDLDTSFENSGNQVLIFTREELKNVDVKINGGKISPKKLTDDVYAFDASYGSKISIEGETENGARSIQGFLSQEKNNPVYRVDSFQFIYDDERSNKMFLTPGVYTYAFFDKYSINAPETGPDTRELRVKVEGEDGDVVLDRKYTSPHPDGTEGAVVDNFNVPRQGNYTLSVDTEDSIYWALVECPICGDGDKDGGEQCDEGNDNGKECEASYGDECSYCSSACELLTLNGPFCGDGDVDGEEQCDKGSDNGEVCFPEYGSECVYCSTSCEEVVVGGSSCGDGVVDEGEDCDMGQENGVGCSPEAGEQCTYCSAGCKNVVNEGVYCGDGIVNQDSEECDDGNNKNGDKCSADCKVEKEEKKEEKEEKKDCGGSIGNYVWNDENSDGVQNNNESGIPDVEVCAHDGNNKMCDKTNDEGRYKIKDLCEGSYDVRVRSTDLKGYYQVYDPDGKLDHKTDVELEGDNDHHTKADFGYRKSKVAPAAGMNFPALLMISTALTAVVLLVFEITRKSRRKKS